MPRIAPKPSSLPRDAFLRACALDVAVRKPGNVSNASPGHGMSAADFIESAEASADALFTPGRRVGERIEAAIAATWAAVGCNTNLGIVLLCAPLAVAFERLPVMDRDTTQAQGRIAAVLASLDVDDAAAAFRAIAQAQPAGLGQVDDGDVHEAPRIDLLEAMRLAADRDRIARQYIESYQELFALGLPACEGIAIGTTSAATTAAVQTIYLRFVSTAPDSHIVRKHGVTLAQNVMTAAKPWRERAEAGLAIDADPDFAAWDDALKAHRLNPGTSADLTVATLMLAGCLHGV